MQLNRFWSSVWGVVAYLFGVALLTYIAVLVGTLFGLVPLFSETGRLITDIAGVVVPAAGTLLYIDWRWNWKAEHIGLTRNAAAAAGWWLLGIAAGVVAALLAHAASDMVAAQSFRFAAPGVRTDVNPLPLVIALLGAFTTELVFRGAAISRYRADLTPREVLIAAPLTPLLWILLQMLLGLGILPAGLFYTYDVAVAIFLALLFLRTDSVWLTAGVRMGFLAALQFLSLRVTDAGGFLVWGVAALVLLAIEWNKQQRMPRRMQPRGGRTGGRTVRGPWGPH